MVNKIRVNFSACRKILTQCQAQLTLCVVLTDDKQTNMLLKEQYFILHNVCNIGKKFW